MMVAGIDAMAHQGTGATDMNCEQKAMDTRQLNDAELDAVSGGLTDRQVKGIIILLGGPIVWAAEGAAYSLSVAEGKA
jgi:hypothetical protein